MNPKTKYNKPIQDYWKYPETGFPKSVWWKKIAGPGKLGILQEYDLVFNEYELRYLKSL